jgi:hypothetical protein
MRPGRKTNTLNVYKFPMTFQALCYPSSKPHMGNRQPSTSLDLTLIHFSELTHEDEIQ